MPNFYALAADLIVAVHFMIVLFVVGSLVLVLAGRILGWAWIRNLVFRAVHLILTAFIAVQSLAGNLCPLTVWESRLRRLAGQAVEGDVFFLARLIRAVIFYDLPAWVFNVIYALFGIIVIMTFVLIPPDMRFGRRRK
ncbi:MAG TPA: DUF2784 domain-containing protein [Syntrophales bacterium]|jgi:hypothetical protein|nr:DUF2784 domain-containing protein [Syntrophales bacterium]